MLRKALIAILLLSAGRLGLSAWHSYSEMNVWGKSVVRLLGNGGGGTGFEIMYRGKQYTMTNDHVCGLESQSHMMVADSPYAAIQGLRVLYRSPNTDICLLEPVKGLPALSFGKSEFANNESITILGHPELKPLYASHGLAKFFRMEDVLLSIIETEKDEKACHLPKNRIVPIFFDLFLACTIHVRAQHTTALIRPGNSGSPVLDYWGRVRGVAFAAGPDNQGDIIPLRDVLKALSAFRHAHK